MTKIVCIDNTGFEFLKIGRVLEMPLHWQKTGFISFIPNAIPSGEPIRVPAKNFMELYEYKNLIVKKRFSLCKSDY